MKTNQMMTVTIGNYGSVLIGHKTKMGKAKDIMAMGNLTRELKGLRPIELKEILSSQDFWEFVVEYHNSNSVESTELKANSNMGDSPHFKQKSNWRESRYLEIDFEMIRQKNGQIAYKKLIQMFPDLIQSKRGKYGGTWMNLYLLLKLATKLDKALEVQIYKTFIEGNILQTRDNGGESFKKINKLISKLPDFDIYNDRHYYKEIARLIRHKVFNLPNYDHYDNIWNEEIATQDKLDERDMLINKFTMLLEDGYIKTYHDLWLKLGGSDPKVEKFILAGL